MTKDKIIELIKVICACITAVCSIVAGTYIGVKNQKQFDYWASQEEKEKPKKEEEKSEPNKEEEKAEPNKEEQKAEVK